MRRYTTVLLLAALLGTTACTKHNQSDAPIVGKALNDMRGMYDQTEARLTTAAHDAMAEGKTNEALSFYGKLYRNNRSDDIVALNYAQLLRKTGNAKEAVHVLAYFVNGRDDEIRGNAKPVMLNEYAAANIQLGNYSLAEKALNKVLEDNKAIAFRPDADDLLGLILDAQNRHKEAEEYYRQALDGWKGDPSAVMNNLGLCLAAQARFDESITILRQALILSPHNEEIASNIKMVSDLRKSVIPTAPIPVTKRQKNP